MSGRGRRTLLAGVVVSLAVAACDVASTEPSPGPPSLDQALIAEGRPLYETHCASCHGIDGAGDPDWATMRADGSFPPPPHDASGHTWHHSDALLIDLIANGSDFAQSRMPAFGDRLTDREILAILEYIKTWWGPGERAFQWEASRTDAWAHPVSRRRRRACR